MIKQLLHGMRQKAANLNNDNILKLLEKTPGANLLDLGCDEGTWSIKLSKVINTNNIHGLDIVDERLNEAKNKGIKTTKGDLNNPLPYEAESFDCIHANQVIEHLNDTDNFITEIHRILKPNGYCIISTENLASWANIISLIFNWQPFSLTNISKKRLGIGNPLAINRGSVMELESWLHKNVMALRGLKEMFEVHGFKIEKATGAGYFPLPAILGRIDPRHSHFITIKARKIT